MIGALWNGISGLNSYQNALSISTNNVANVNTVGYKSDKVSFADMMYQDGVGKGAKQASIYKDFDQGNIKLTGGDYDFAVEGKGFFIVNNEKLDENLYTRAGNFRVGNDGRLQTPNGYLVQGIPTGTGVVTSTDANVTSLTSDYSQFMASQIVETATGIMTINAKATNYTQTAVSSGTSGTDYKTSSAKKADVEALSTAYSTALSSYASNPVAGTTPVAQVASIDFSTYATDLTKAGDYLSVLVGNRKIRQEFDTDAATTLNSFADKISEVTAMQGTANTTTGTITITSLLPGIDINITNADENGAVYVPTINTAAIAGSGLAAVDTLKAALSVAVQRAGAQFIDITNTIDLSREATLNIGDIQTKLDTLGFSDSQFGTVEVSDGVIYLSQGDNKFAIGKVATAAFTNNLELRAQGDNAFKKSDGSGDPVDASKVSRVLGGALELSNTALSEGLVDLMVYQRAFEANSKTLSAADDFLTTAIQLKK